MKNIKLLFVAIVVFVLYPISSFAGDTQGKVAKITVRDISGTYGSLQIFFATNENDRFGCIQSVGYVKLSDQHPSLTARSLDRIYAMALMAKATGKSLAIDSDASDPCNMGTQAWLLD